MVLRESDPRVAPGTVALAVERRILAGAWRFLLPASQFSLTSLASCMEWLRCGSAPQSRLPQFLHFRYSARAGLRRIAIGWRRFGLAPQCRLPQLLHVCYSARADPITSSGLSPVVAVRSSLSHHSVECSLWPHCGRAGGGGLIRWSLHKLCRMTESV